MRKIDPSILERLSRKYSQYGTIFDADSKGSTEASNIPWNISRMIVLERDSYKCRICGKSPIIDEIEDGKSKIRFDVEVHHIIPRIAGGSNSTKNLVTLCRECHIKTFKNEYKGLPVESIQLYKTIEVFTDSKKIIKIGSSCQKYEVNSFFFNDIEFKTDIPIKGNLCQFKSLEYLYSFIEENNIDIDEIITKNKKGDFIVGLIENYQPI